MKTITKVSIHLVLFCLCINFIRCESDSSLQATIQHLNLSESIDDNQATSSRELRENSPFFESTNHVSKNEHDNICFEFNKKCGECVKQPSCYFCMNDQRCLHGSIVVQQLQNNLNITKELDGPYCRASAVCRYKEFIIVLFSMTAALLSLLIFCYAVYNFRKNKPNIYFEYM